MLVLHNVRMIPSNVRKNKGTTECDKSTIICDISTTQCNDGTIKCDILVTWYSRLPTNGYSTLFFWEGGTVELPLRLINLNVYIIYTINNRIRCLSFIILRTNIFSYKFLNSKK